MANSDDIGGRDRHNAPQKTRTAARLSPRASDLLTDRQGALPVWIRAPKSGTEFYSGFSRAKLYEGAGKGHFRSVSIREPGQVKGTRLFHLQSILDFVEECEQASNLQRELNSTKGGEE